MPKGKSKDNKSHERIDKLEDDISKRRDAFTNCREVDELFEKTIVDKSEFTHNEVDCYEYYRDELTKFEAEFKKFGLQFVWGHDESKWSKDPEMQKKYRASRLNYKKDLFDDALRAHYNDERFIKGAEVARFVDVDSNLVKRSAEIIRRKQNEYKNMSGVGRFFSYLNPFSNKYRQMRNEIARLKDKVVDVTQCDRKALEDFVNGKTKEMPYEKGDAYTFEALNGFLVSAEQEKDYGISREEFVQTLENSVNLEAQVSEPTVTESLENTVQLDQPDLTQKGN